MKKCAIFVIFILLSGIMSNAAASDKVLSSTKSPKEKGHEALSKLYKAHEEGEITNREYIVQLGYFLYHPDLIDPRFKPEPGAAIKCGTGMVIEFQENFHLMSQAEQDFFADTKARPNPPSQHFFDTTHFRLHYDTTGGSAIFEPTVDVDPADGVPDFINRAAEAAEYVWDMETGASNYNYSIPPYDGTDGGGYNLYDFYFYEIGVGYYGYTAWDGSGTGTYPDRPNCAKSYIALHRNFWFADVGNVDGMRITIAHEFHHATQMAYNSTSDSVYVAFMENCAVNMEENVYDDINDYYGWINPRYNRPQSSLRDFDQQIEYATVIWAMFLQQNWSHDLVHEMWENAITYSNFIDLYDQVFLAEIGLNLREAYQIWTEWFFISGGQDDGYHFEEGAEWEPYITVLGESHVRIKRTHDTYPASGDQSPDREPDRLGCNFINFDVSNTTDYGIEVNFNGNIGHAQDAWGLTFITHNATYDTYQTSHYMCDSNGDLTVQVYDHLQQFDTITMCVQNLRKYGLGVNTYSYTATLVTQEPPPVPTLSQYALILLLVLLSGILYFHRRFRKVTVAARR